VTRYIGKNAQCSTNSCGCSCSKAIKSIRNIRSVRDCGQNENYDQDIYDPGPGLLPVLIYEWNKPGIIAVFAIVIRKELLIPVLCGIFFAEILSVVLQVSWFKRTKRKYGEGRRIFLMAPLHHHYQKKGYPEPKIVTRFWIIGLILAVISIVTLKIR